VGLLPCTRGVPVTDFPVAKRGVSRLPTAPVVPSRASRRCLRAVWIFRKGYGVVPVPDKYTVCGLLLASSFITILAVSAPTIVGLKMM
jgi:hypothetical protein